ncbi:MAG: oligosaccharide flippase family protein [Nonlabens sp.]
MLDKLPLWNKIKSDNSALLSGTAWTILGAGISRGCLLIGSLICANILGSSLFGEYSLIRNTVNMFAVLGGINLGSLISKYISQYNLNKDLRDLHAVFQIYLLCFTLIVITGILLVVFADPLSTRLLGAPHLKYDLYLSLAIIGATIFYSLNENVYRGLMKFKKLGIIQILCSLTFLIMVPAGAYWYGVTGAVLGYLAFAVFFSFLSLLQLGLLNIRSLKKLRSISIKNLDYDSKEFKKMIVPVFFSSLVDAPAFYAVQVIFVFYYGMSDFGIASAFLQIRNLALIVPGYVSLVLLPILSRFYTQNDRTRYSKNLNTATVFSLLFSCAIAIILVATSHLTIDLYGFEVVPENVGYISLIIYGTVPLFVLSNLFHQTLLIKNLGLQSLYVSLGWNVIFVLSAFLFIDLLDLGIVGFMWSQLVGILLQLLSRIYFDRKIKFS